MRGKEESEEDSFFLHFFCPILARESREIHESRVRRERKREREGGKQLVIVRGKKGAAFLV